MSTNVTLNGVTYAIPAEGDSGWGTVLANYFIAIGSSTLQKSGGTFTLTAEANFGATYGLKSAYLKSQATNPSATGILRLGNAELVAWRNAANSADLGLTVSAGNLLQFNGSSVLMPGLGSIVNADVNAAAAIAYSKLALTGAILNADLAGSIAYSKLSLTGAILNTDLAGSIAYSKLSLGTSIVNADISTSAAIALSKLAATTASRALVSDGSGFISAATTTATEIDYVNGVTSAIQTQLDAKVAKSTFTTKGDVLAASGSATPVRVAVGSDGTFLKADSSQAAGVVFASVAGAALAVASKTTTYTATTADDFIQVTTGSAWTLTLYAASGNSGKVLRIKKTSSDTNALTIDGNASETIDGATTQTISLQYEEMTILCDGSNWHII